MVTEIDLSLASIKLQISNLQFSILNAKSEIIRMNKIVKNNKSELKRSKDRLFNSELRENIQSYLNTIKLTKKNMQRDIKLVKKHKNDRKRLLKDPNYISSI